MLESINLDIDIKKVEKLGYGWSYDQKYILTDMSENKYLLRISDSDMYEKRKYQFEYLKKIDTLNLNTPKTVQFGITGDNKVFTLLTWVEGIPAKRAIAGMSDLEQYNYGLEAGTIMRKIHSISLNAKPERTWGENYKLRIARKIKTVSNCKVEVPHREFFIQYILDNMHLVMNRPQRYQHGDYHLGNMLINNGKLGIIDFDRSGLADPYVEFKPFSWNVIESPYFETGLVDGYFNYEIPEDFFPILALYSVESMIAHIPWAVKFGKEEVEIGFKLIEKNMEWYKDYKITIPTWYKRPKMN